MAWLLLLLAPLAFADENGMADLSPSEAAKKAVEWREACEKTSDGRACGDLGALYAQGRGVPRDAAKAFAYFEKACRFGQPLRCLRAAIFALNGHGTALSAERGAELLGIGCKLLDADACSAYYAVIHGQVPGLDGRIRPLADPPKPDRKVVDEIRVALALACEKGRANACGNLAGVYEEGDAALADSKKALKYYERACELGDEESCARAGRYYANAEGAAIDRGKAAQLFRRYCELRHELVCPLARKAEMGLPIELKLSRHVPDPKLAPGGDHVPLWAIEQPLARIVPDADLDADTKQLIEDCNHGSARSCGNAAARFVDRSGKPKSHAELARRLYGKACGLGRGVRCADLSRFHAHGWGTPVAKDREAAALRRACDLGYEAACVPVPKGP